MDIENLVFEGGGVKGIAYAGAIEALHEHGIFENVKAVAGTSAGSIVSGLVALGYSPAEIKDVVGKTDFSTFMDHKSIARIPFSYGLYKGDAFLDWMKDKVKRKMGNENATFKDLHDKGMREIRVFATDLNMKVVKEFSFRKTPTVRLAEACRASMSIPVFFKAWQFTDNNPDNHIYVDGGAVYNYPMTTFDEGGENMKTLGLHLDNLGGHQVNDGLKMRQLVQYVKDMFDTLMHAQVIAFEKNPELLKRSIRIDDLGISGTNFDLSKQDQDRLYQSGYKAAQEYIKSHT